ncbi:MAG: ABC transporter permease, partial [Phototrophicaceae bacterium]
PSCVVTVIVAVPFEIAVILVGLISTLIAMGIGCLMGSVSVFTVKMVDSILLVVFDTLASIPTLLFSLLILTLFGNGINELIWATALPQIIPVAYGVRGAISLARGHEYVGASRALGATTLHIVGRHILPSLLNTLLAYSMITMRYCLMMSTTVTFLGFGGEPGVADWGVMLADARMAFRVAPWTSIPPGLGILFWVMWLNYLAEYIGKSLAKLK